MSVQPRACSLTSSALWRVSSTINSGSLKNICSASAWLTSCFSTLFRLLPSSHSNPSITVRSIMVYITSIYETGKRSPLRQGRQRRVHRRKRRRHWCALAEAKIGQAQIANQTLVKKWTVALCGPAGAHASCGPNAHVQVPYRSRRNKSGGPIWPPLSMISIPSRFSTSECARQSATPGAR